MEKERQQYDSLANGLVSRKTVMFCTMPRRAGSGPSKAHCPAQNSAHVAHRGTATLPAAAVVATSTACSCSAHTSTKLPMGCRAMRLGAGRAPAAAPATLPVQLLPLSRPQYCDAGPGLRALPAVLLGIIGPRIIGGAAVRATVALRGSYITFERI